MVVTCKCVFFLRLAVYTNREVNCLGPSIQVCALRYGLTAIVNLNLMHFALVGPRANKSLHSHKIFMILSPLAGICSKIAVYTAKGSKRV